MREKPRPQELYRHFKGNMYQVLTLATDSETMKEMVVYQALYGEYKVYVRPLDSFMSEVDRDRYPGAEQKMRFEKINKRADTSDRCQEAGSEMKSEKGEKSIDSSDIVKIKDIISKPQDESERGNVIRPQITHDSIEKNGYHRPSEQKTEKSAYMEKSIDEEARELNLDPLVIKFMDAELAVEKNEILSKLRPTITNDMIDIMALSLGVVVKEGDVYDRFNDLRTCLNTIEKFESTRLRS